jgi:hypothetical protein
LEVPRAPGVWLAGSERAGTAVQIAALTPAAGIVRDGAVASDEVAGTLGEGLNAIEGSGTSVQITALVRAAGIGRRRTVAAQEVAGTLGILG